MKRKPKVRKAVGQSGEVRLVVKASSLTLDPHNARFHTDSDIEAIASSLRQFGQQTPVKLGRRDGQWVVLKGNGTVQAAQSIDPDADVWLSFSDLKDQDAELYALADNRTAELSSWDWDALAEALSRGHDPDTLVSFGFDDNLAKEMKAALAGTQRAEEDGLVGEPTASPVAKPGDLWMLGRHRLLCGDSTSEKDVQRLIGGLAGGITPQLMVTDPPYGVEYEPAWRNDADGGKRDRVGKVSNDDRADWTDAWKLFPGDVAYVWHADVKAAEVQRSIEGAGFATRSQIIWVKSRFALSRGDYHWQHEPCWYAVRNGKAGMWVGGRSQSTTWEIPLSSDDMETTHGTQKPVECMARPIRNHDADCVYEPFAGSGSTLIACEQLERICLAMELDPAYCDLIIERWEAFTGNKAAKL